MTYTAITASETEAGKPVTTSLMNKVRTNLDDLDSRVASLGGNYIIWNEIINYKSLPQGAMLWSFETEANFQLLYGDEWSLVDSSVSNYIDKDGNSISVPNASDRYLMNKGSGAEVSRGLLAQRTKLPTNPFVHPLPVGTGTGGVITALDTSSGYSGTSPSLYTSTATGGDSVTRPNSVVANLFIKNSEETTTRRMVFRASSSMTLNTAKITQFEAGPSGTLEVNIKKGATLGTVTTVFSTNPSVIYSAGNNASSSNAVFSDTAVAVNDWIVLEIVSLQNTRSEFHLQVEANATT